MSKKLRFALQRFASVTITPNVALKNGSTIKVAFHSNGDNEATFTYNAANKSFSETHSGWFFEAARASINNNNIVIQLDDFAGDFSDSGE